MKFRAHDTFFIRKGWLSKGMKAVHNCPDLFVSKKENPMDVLGLGANMVKALRYWLPAVGLTEERVENRRRVQVFTPFGQCVFTHDRYIEELGTLYLIHYQLAKNQVEATSWYFFFNEFSMSEFTKEDFVQNLQNYVSMHGESVAIRSLNDDFACLLNTYLSRHKTSQQRVSPENNISCPLGELGLVDILDKRKHTYRKVTPTASLLNPWIIYAVLIEQAGRRRQISLNELLTAQCNIGRIFNLDAIAMLDVLHEVELRGLLKIIRTAGLDVIELLEDLDFQDCVEHYYMEMDNE